MLGTIKKSFALRVSETALTDFPLEADIGYSERLLFWMSFDSKRTVAAHPFFTTHSSTPCKPTLRKG